MSMGVTQDLRAACDDAWAGLVENSFVAEIADGTLPLEKFRYYIEQNLFYLPRYARMLDLAVAHSETVPHTERFTRALTQIVDVEIPANRELLAEVVAMGAEDRGGGDEPTEACLAYSTFLMSTAASGDSRDVMAAMLPCAWSYADIAARYPAPAAHPVYRQWLGVFGGLDYQAYIENLLRQVDELVGDVSEDDLVRLQGTFLTAVGMEASFWAMAYAME